MLLSFEHNIEFVVSRYFTRRDAVRVMVAERIFLIRSGGN